MAAKHVFCSTDHTHLFACTGLNNTQVCVVRNRVLHKYPSAGKTAIPKQDADEELAVTRNATGNATASCYSPSLETLEQGEPGTSWPMTGE